MKTSTRHRAVPDALEVRLSDYERQAHAHLATHGPRKEGEPDDASAAASVPPDLAAPGFVSFTGGPSRESVNVGAPRNVSLARAAFYAELDESFAIIEADRASKAD